MGQLILTLGGRYDWALQTDNDILSSTIGKKTDTAFTGRAGLIYLFDNGFAPYVSYSTSFMPYSGFDGQNNPFKPTTGEQWEVGLKYEPVGYDALITVSAFDLKQKNVPTYDEFTYLPAQTGEIHVQGIEIEGKATVFDSLDLIAAASYTDSVYSKADDGTQGTRFVSCLRSTYPFGANTGSKMVRSKGSGLAPGCVTQAADMAMQPTASSIPPTRSWMQHCPMTLASRIPSWKAWN